MNKWIKFGAISFILLALVSAGTITVLAASTTWNLSKAVSNDNKVMTRSASVTGLIEMDPATPVTWITDEVALAGGNVFKQGGDDLWILRLHANEPWKTYDAEMTLGYYPDDETTPAYVPLTTPSEISIPVIGSDTVLELKIQDANIVIPAGKHLAVQVTSNDTISHDILTDTSSWLRTPADDPENYAPELTTGLLLGLGLLGIGGVVWCRRWRNAVVEA